MTINTIIYDEDIELMRKIVDAAKEAGISAVIAADVAVMAYCNKVGQEVHLSTQLNISNAEALKFYAQFADVVVLARELNLQTGCARCYDGKSSRKAFKGPDGMDQSFGIDDVLPWSALYGCFRKMLSQLA